MKKYVSSAIMLAAAGFVNASMLAEWTFDETGSGSKDIRMSAALAATRVAEGGSISGLVFNPSFDFAGFNNVPKSDNDEYGFGNNRGQAVLFIRRAQEKLPSVWGSKIGTGISDVPLSFSVSADSGRIVTLTGLTITRAGGPHLILHAQEAGMAQGPECTLKAENSPLEISFSAPLVIASGETKTVTMHLNSGQYGSIHMLDSIVLKGTVAAVGTVAEADIVEAVEPVRRKKSTRRKSDRPNLLVLLTDDQRLDTIGTYDANCPIQTPNLDRLANEGIRFENGFVTTPICCVSRASILTGRYESNTRMHQFQTLLPADVFEQSYNMILEDAGYFTGQLGKYGVLLKPEQTRRFSFWDAQEGQGPKFRDYKGKKMHDAEWLTVRTEEFLDAVPKNKPFCLQVNYKEPHGSSCPAPEDDHLLDNHVFERHPMDTPEMAEKVNEFVRNSFLDVCYRQEFNKGGDHNPFLRNYYEKIVSVERSVGKIMNMLEQRGLADNTVIVFLSDHGVHFGEKHLYGKWTPYDASLRIPFIIYDPRPQARKEAVDDRMVLNIDIAPTLLDLAGVKIPDIMDGQSLVPLLTSDSRSPTSKKWRSHFFYEHFCSPAPVKYIPRNEGLRTTTEKYVHWIDPQCDKEEFYDLVNDPEEINNLIDNPEYKTRVDAARREFKAWREKNPSTYSYDVYGRRAQALAPEIDWEQFKQAHPDAYEKIAVQIKRFGVTWEQAMNDWKIRYKICSHAGYWY